MAGLGVNIDHVATVRQARLTVEPDPIWAAAEAQLGGADCITFHLRKDRRHITDRDARLLKQTVSCKLNMEMSLDPEIVDIALELAPTQATLVPENRQEITTEGGLDVIAHADRIAEVTSKLTKAGVIVSAFIDPDPDQILAARHAGCQAMEIHTGTYANACIGADGANPDPNLIATTLAEIRAGLQAGLEAELIVHAGHGLTYTNIEPITQMQGFCEFNIGHSIIARALFTGLRRAVAKMKRLVG
ncbi:MAG: pyridoxine 5'-phosphate synthase [Phycisphaerae bacterium]|jgi:pyridoxine 5-phosphate synthase|nr:pyridoxine 5'-phosphate synthase [Phycisphaerae bacterium]MDP7288802.1 pyridoxine 5'-phosphate synthase [Phycisphaerae bacterium]